MVQFKNVSKIYSGSISAVKDISFSVEEGEFIFLIGPSGSGKTTIIKMLIRDEIPTSGKIFFNDIDITKIKRRKVYQLRREIGVVFQDYKLVPEKNVFENVAFAMEAAGKKDKEIKETVPYVLDIVGLENRISSFPRELSGGEQQRVAIARAIANNPKILIADEPTGNLDPASSWDIVQVLTKINSWGTTIIMSTHGTEIVNSLNKRVVQMHSGSIIRDDNKGQYEMTGNYESSVLIVTDRLTNPFEPQKDEEVSNKKEKKNKSKSKQKDSKSESIKDRLGDRKLTSEAKTTDDLGSSPSDSKIDSDDDTIDLHITLGHKGVKIPVKKQKETQAQVVVEEKVETVQKENENLDSKDTKSKKKKSTWFESLKVSDNIKQILNELKVSSYEEFIENGLEELSDHQKVTDEVLEEIAHALEEDYKS